METEKNNNMKAMIVLHVMFLVFSLAGVLTKFAAGYDILSIPFLLFYGGSFVILAVYAIAWQQILKYVPLTAAYVNKSVTIIWGLFWGIIIFGEELSKRKIVGSLLVIAGVIWYAFADGADGTNAVSEISDETSPDVTTDVKEV